MLVASMRFAESGGSAEVMTAARQQRTVGTSTGGGVGGVGGGGGTADSVRGVRQRFDVHREDDEIVNRLSAETGDDASMVNVDVVSEKVSELRSAAWRSG